MILSKQKRAVLLFHRVSPVRDRMWDPMDPALFENILRYAGKKYHVLPLEELLFSPPRSAKPLAAITFDDGYTDFIDYSIPLLEKYSMPASMFVVTDCIDNDLPTWTYIIDHYFEKTRRLEVELDFHSLPSSVHQDKWNDDEDRIRFGKKLKQQMKWIPSGERNDIIKKILTGFSDVERPSGGMMSWEDVSQAYAAGYGIGSHSITHETLATIGKDEDLKNELVGSKKIIKERTGIETDIFSYPCGSYDARVMRLTQEAGYRAGLAVDGKMYDPAKDDVYAVPRIELYNESWLKSRSRVNGTMSIIEKILQR